jgi:hypothetical protein
MSKRECIGSIFTDVASIVIGDPCKMLPDKRGNRHTYEELAEAKFGDRERDPKQPVALGNDLIALPTVENCDGWCDVYVERDMDGWPLRVIIDLSAKAQPASAGGKRD